MHRKLRGSFHIRPEIDTTQLKIISHQIWHSTVCHGATHCCSLQYGATLHVAAVDMENFIVKAATATLSCDMTCHTVLGMKEP